MSIKNLASWNGSTKKAVYSACNGSCNGSCASPDKKVTSSCGSSSCGSHAPGTPCGSGE